MKTTEADRLNAQLKSELTSYVHHCFTHTVLIEVQCYDVTYSYSNTCITISQTAHTVTAPVTYPAIIIQNLDLSRVAEFDHGSHRDVKLSARFKVQPHIVALEIILPRINNQRGKRLKFKLNVKKETKRKLDIVLTN